jgi:hypothetical protein
VATTLSTSERARLDAALAAICRTAGIQPTGASLIRYTMNAVYRIDHAGVVVRMTAGPTAAKRVEHVASVAAAFTKLGLPTIELTPTVRQPVHADGWWATIWTLLPQNQDRLFHPQDLAVPLHAVHALTDQPIQLPRWNPIGTARRRLNGAAALDGPALDYLHAWAATVGVPFGRIFEYLSRWCDELEAALADVPWTLPVGVIHGDAHTGNLLQKPDGTTVICDFDSVTIGPREWDLVPAAHGVHRFGRDHAQYMAFAQAYGVDVTALPCWETLRQVRELQLVTSVVANLPGRPDVANQAAYRLRSILDRNTTAVWRRYQ